MTPGRVCCGPGVVASLRNFSKASKLDMLTVLCVQFVLFVVCFNVLVDGGSENSRWRNREMQVGARGS